MGIRDHLGAQDRVTDLPTWRKIIVLTGLAVCLFLGWMAAWNEIRIYYSAPSQRTVATGQTYETHVMHGSIRYVSFQEQERLRFWEDEALPRAGIPFLNSFFTYDMTPRKRAQP